MSQLKAPTPGGDRRPGQRTEDAADRLSAAADRTDPNTDERLAQDQERHEDDAMDDWDFDRLPNLPDLPGFKTIWLSTTHPQDTPQNRMRLGYTPITSADLGSNKQYDHLFNGDPDSKYKGMIQVNEMVGFKLPLARWQKFMNHFHHDKPNEEESAIRDIAEQLEDEHRDSKGRKVLIVEDGTRGLGRGSRRGRFG